MSILDKLDKRNLISPTSQKLRDLVKTHFHDLYSAPFTKPSEYVSQMYRRYLQLPSNWKSNSMNGSIFHLIVAVVLYRSGIHPLHQEASITFVPHAIFDIVAFKNDGSIVCFSLKTSFRERWKQADLEARALKMVHRTAKCLLISYEIDDADNTQRKIASGGAIALDDAISAVTDRFDNLLVSLQSTSFVQPPTVPMMEKAQLSSLPSL